MNWGDSLSYAERGVRPIYARIDKRTYYDLDSVCDAVQTAFAEVSTALVRGGMSIQIDIEREVMLAEVVATLSGVRKSVKIIEDAKFIRDTTTREAVDAGLPLLVAADEVAEKLSTTHERVSAIQVLDVIARLVVAEEGVQVRPLSRKSVVKLLKGETVVIEFEATVARYNYLAAQESLTTGETEESAVLKKRLDRYPAVDDASKLRLMIDDETWRRLLFGGGAKE